MGEGLQSLNGLRSVSSGRFFRIEFYAGVLSFGNMSGVGAGLRLLLFLVAKGMRIVS